MNQELRQLAEACRGEPRHVNVLSEHDVWLNPEPQIWRAGSFTGSPLFYPVYRWRDCYSFSPLALILHKGCLCLNPRVAKASTLADFLCFSGTETIDTEITRVGGPMKPTFSIRSADGFVQAICSAMRADAAAVESLYPGYTNAILVGGKDSENLALLPWKNPTMLLSAPPNYELNRQFVKENELPYPVVPLHDDDFTTRDIEILENCCRINLKDARWAGRLRRFAEEHHGKVIFWKGQLGDTFTTPFWKTYVRHGRSASLYPRKLRPYRLRVMVHALWGRFGFLQRRFFDAQWFRGAMWQGSHMSILRQATGCLVLSGYHGRKMRQALIDVNLYHSVREDIRPLIGASLLGKTVWYPSANPSPPTSVTRSSWSTSDTFLDLLRGVNIPIHE